MRPDVSEKKISWITARYQRIWGQMQSSILHLYLTMKQRHIIVQGPILGGPQFNCHPPKSSGNLGKGNLR